MAPVDDAPSTIDGAEGRRSATDYLEFMGRMVPIISGLCTIIGVLAGWIVSARTSRTKREKAISDGVLALLRAQLVDAYERYVASEARPEERRSTRGDASADAVKRAHRDTIRTLPWAGMGGVALDVFEGLLHWWPIVSMVGGGVIGWVSRALRDYHRKDQKDHETLAALTEDVRSMKTDLDAIKVGNVAEYQESISDAHTRYVVHGTPLTIAARGRINLMMQSLSALDDMDGTYQRLVDEINALPIWQPDETLMGDHR